MATERPQDGLHARLDTTERDAAADTARGHLRVLVETLPPEDVLCLWRLVRCWMLPATGTDRPIA